VKRFFSDVHQPQEFSAFSGHHTDKSMRFAGDLLTKMSAEQRTALSYGPTYRSHYLKTERISQSALAQRVKRFFSNMQEVAAPSPAVLMPLFVLLCQQTTLLVKSLAKGSRKASPGIVFQV
jgi:hypothetical protein